MAETLLCIDDDPKAIDALRTAVGPSATVIPCADLDEAFEVLVVEQPDLVVLEVRLQAGNGLDFVERMRRSKSEVAATPVIVVTRVGRAPGVHGRAMQLGVAGYFSKPAPGTALAEAVREQLEKGRRAASVELEKSQLGIGAGRLTDLPLAELFDRVHRRAESGVLIVGDARERTGIQIRNGSPVAVSLPSDEGVDDFLIRQGRLTEEDRELAIAQAPLGLGGVEAVLIDAGLLDDEELEAAIRQQAEEAIFELFELPKGRYRFEPGRRLKGARSLELVRSPQSLLVRGILAWAPIEKVREALSRYADLYVAASAEPEPVPEDVPCSEAQRDFVDSLAGDRCVADFLDGSEFELRTLYAFAILGAIGLSAEPMLTLDDAVAMEVAEPTESAAADDEVLELDDAIEEPPDLSYEDSLFDGAVVEAEASEATPDLSYEEDLFEERAFEEDSFENEMVAEEQSGEHSLVEIERLVGPESDLPLEAAPEPVPEPVVSVEEPEPETAAGSEPEAKPAKKKKAKKPRRKKVDAGPAKKETEEAAKAEPELESAAPEPEEPKPETKKPAARKAKKKPRKSGRKPVEPDAPPVAEMPEPTPAPVVESLPPVPEPAPEPAVAAREATPPEPEVPAEPAAPAAGEKSEKREKSAESGTDEKVERAPTPSDRIAEPRSGRPKTAGGGYEIAPLGSVQTDPAERALIAARVQKRLDRRYAQLLERKKAPDEAAAAAESNAARALEAESWFRKGSELLKLKRYDDAVEAFGMSAHHDPKEGEYVAHLGYALYLSKPDNETVRKEALEDIARGIKLSPDRELPYVYLGRIFKVQDNQAEARKMFERALQIRPHCRQALQEIRLMDMREKKKSAGLLGRLLK